MRKAAYLTILGVLATTTGGASAQSLKQVDCGAFKRQPDGSYRAVKDTSIVDASDNAIDIGDGQIIGPRSIMLNGWSAREMIDQKCAAAPAAQPPTPAAASTPPPLPPPPSLIPTPPPLPPESVFYYDDGGKPAGPFNLADLEAKVAAGAIRRDTLVWKSGTPAWVAAKDLPELSSTLSPATAAPADDIHSFFVGTWEVAGPAPGVTDGIARMELTFGQDGKVRGSYRVHVKGTAGSTVSIVTGEWSAKRDSDTQADVSLNLLIHGPNGESQPLNSTSTVEILDNDTLRDTSDGTVTKRVKR